MLRCYRQVVEQGYDLTVVTVYCVLQYAAMFVSAGEAGDAKKVQTSVAAARKVFRIFRVSMQNVCCPAQISQAWLYTVLHHTWCSIMH